MNIKKWFTNVEFISLSIIVLCTSPFIIPTVHAANHLVNPPLASVMKSGSEEMQSGLYQELEISENQSASNGLTPPVLQDERYPVLDEL